MTSFMPVNNFVGHLLYYISQLPMKVTSPIILYLYCLIFYLLIKYLEPIIDFWSQFDAYGFKYV